MERPSPLKPFSRTDGIDGFGIDGFEFDMPQHTVVQLKKKDE